MKTQRIAWRAGLALAVTLCGCQVPKLGGVAVFDPADGEAPAKAVDLTKAVDPAKTSDRLMTEGVAGLTGNVTSPPAVLVGNNSANLADLGGIALFRSAFRLQGVSSTIQALSQSAVSGAKVKLVDASGAQIGTETVETDKDGKYRFATLPESDGTVFVQAEFSGAGKEFRFRSLVPELTKGASADVDAATTLLGDKIRALLAGKKLDPALLAAAKVRALADRLRGKLSPEVIPFMAADSRDIVPGFDQLALDIPEIGDAARDLAPRLAAPAESWTVSTVASSDDLIKWGVYDATMRTFSQAGSFEVDAAGNLYFPTMVAPGKPVEIVRVDPVTGQKATVAKFPNDRFVNPVSITFGRDGTIYAVAVGLDKQALRVFSAAAPATGSTATLAEWPGDIAPVPPGTPLDGPVIGRIAVDDRGTLFMPVPFKHVVLSLVRTAPAGQIVGGIPDLPEWADGPGPESRFKFPRSLVRGPGGTIFVADEGNLSIRNILPPVTGSWAVRTVSGHPGEASYRNGRGEYARFGSPGSLVFDSRADLYVSDTFDGRIRRLSPDGSVFLVAGTGVHGNADGAAHEATFNNPGLLAIDGRDNLYVVDAIPAAPGGKPTELIRKISRQ